MSQAALTMENYLGSGTPYLVSNLPYNSAEGFIRLILGSRVKAYD